MNSARAQEAVRQRDGGEVPYEDIRGEQTQGRQTQPAVPEGSGLLQAEDEQVLRHAAPRVRQHHERIQQDREVSTTTCPIRPLQGVLFIADN